MGRCIEQNDCGDITRYTYTPTGKLKQVIDAEGNLTEYTYDEIDVLSKVYRQDSKGNELKSEENQALHITTYDHDLSGKVTCITDALGQKEIYKYDRLGRLNIKTDRDNLTTSYEYTKTGQISQISYADGKSVKMSYDALGRLSELDDWMGKTSIASDALGRAVRVTDYNGRTIEYAYTPEGKRSEIIYPDGHKVYYKYDDNRLLSSLINENADEVEETLYEYDKFGRLVAKIFPNGAASRYEYYQGGLLKTIKNSDAEGILDDITYQYNNKGLRTDVTRNRRDMNEISGRYTYSYDCIERLKDVAFNGNLTKSYSYDAFGNRRKMTQYKDGQIVTTDYYYDSIDRLLLSKETKTQMPEVVTAYSYDKRGNITGVTKNDVTVKTYSFDATGMMTGASDSDIGDISYDYNGLGFRVGLERPNEKIEYLCDITRDSYNVLERTVNGVSEFFAYDDKVVSISRRNESSYYLQDEMGSTNWMTGTDGLAYESYAYDEFGTQIDKYTKDIHSGKGIRKNYNYTKDGNNIQPFTFTGYQKDEVSDLYFAQARYYDDNVGRFTAEDQMRGLVASPDTQNHYIYCWNNSITYVDLNGLYPVDPNGSNQPLQLQMGNEAHQKLQEELARAYGADTEVYVYYDEDEEIYGKADVVYYNKATGTAEVYEIKSFRTYAYRTNKDGTVTTLFPNYYKGQAQLNKYVDSFNDVSIDRNRRKLQSNGCNRATRGRSLDEHINNFVVDSDILPGYEIVYHTDGNGMVYWWYRRKDSGKKDPIVKADDKGNGKGEKDNLVEYIEKQLKENEKLVAMVALLIALGLLADDIWGGVADDPAAIALLIQVINYLNGTASSPCPCF